MRLRLPPVVCLLVVGLLASGADGMRPTGSRSAYALADRTRDHTPSDREVVKRRLGGQTPEAADRLLGPSDCGADQGGGASVKCYYYPRSTLIVTIQQGRVTDV